MIEGFMPSGFLLCFETPFFLIKAIWKYWSYRPTFLCFGRWPLENSQCQTQSPTMPTILPLGIKAFIEVVLQMH